MRNDSWTPSAPAQPRGNAPRPAPAFLGAAFNNFLYATAVEADGGAVTVLSALARQDLDPWAEAGKLAQLPKDAAAHKLAGLIAPHCNGTSPAELRKTATRLVGLLPAAPLTAMPAQIASAGLPVIKNARAIIMFLLVFVVVMLGIQLAMHFSVASSPVPITKVWAGHGAR
jgi:hypothetical protein